MSSLYKEKGISGGSGIHNEVSGLPQGNETGAYVRKPILRSPLDRLEKVKQRIAEDKWKMSKLGMSPTKTLDSRNSFEKFLGITGHHTVIGDAMDIFNRPQQALWGLISPKENTNSFMSMLEGLSGRYHQNTADFLNNGFGIDTKNWNPFLKGIAAFGIDVGTDPMAYWNAPFEWMGKGVKKGFTVLTKGMGTVLRKSEKGNEFVNTIGDISNKIKNTFKATFGTWKNPAYNSFKEKLIGEQNRLLRSKETLVRSLSKRRVEINRLAIKLGNDYKSGDETTKKLAKYLQLDKKMLAKNPLAAFHEGINQHLFNEIQATARHSISRKLLWDKLMNNNDGRGSHFFILAGMKHTDERVKKILKVLRDDFAQGYKRGDLGLHYMNELEAGGIETPELSDIYAEKYRLKDMESKVPGAVIKVRGDAAKWMRINYDKIVGILKRQRQFGKTKKLKSLLTLLATGKKVDFNLADPSHMALLKSLTKYLGEGSYKSFGRRGIKFGMRPNGDLPDMPGITLKPTSIGNLRHMIHNHQDLISALNVEQMEDVFSKLTPEQQVAYTSNKKGMTAWLSLPLGTKVNTTAQMEIGILKSLSKAKKKISEFENTNFNDAMAKLNNTPESDLTQIKDTIDEINHHALQLQVTSSRIINILVDAIGNDIKNTNKDFILKSFEDTNLKGYLKLVASDETITAIIAKRISEGKFQGGKMGTEAAVGVKGEMGLAKTSDLTDTANEKVQASGSNNTQYLQKKGGGAPVVHDDTVVAENDLTVNAVGSEVANNVVSRWSHSGAVSWINAMCGRSLFSTDPIRSIGISLKMIPDQFRLLNIFSSATEEGLIRQISKSELMEAKENVEKGGMPLRKALTRSLKGEFQFINEAQHTKLKQLWAFLAKGNLDNKSKEFKEFNINMSKLLRQKNVVIHKGLFGQLELFASHIADVNADKTNILRTINRWVIKAWKEVALFSTGYHVRNVATNTMNAYLSGMRVDDFLYHQGKALKELHAYQGISKKIEKHMTNNPEQWVNSSRSISKKAIHESIMIKSILTKEEWRTHLKIREWTNASMIGNNKFSRDEYDLLHEVQAASKVETTDRHVLKAAKLNHVVNGFNRMRKLNFGITQISDNASRVAAYEWAKTSKARKVLKTIGLDKDPEKEIKFAKRVFYDYGNSTPNETKYLKSIFPFYTWFRNNMEFQMKNFLKNSKRYFRVADALKGWSQGITNGDSTLAQNNEEMGYIPMWNSNGDVHYLRFAPPYWDVEHLIHSPLNRLSPLIKDPIQLATGTDLFTKQSLASSGGFFGSVGNTLIGEPKLWGENAIGEKVNRMRLGMLGSRLTNWMGGGVNLAQGKGWSRGMPTIFKDVNIANADLYHSIGERNALTNALKQRAYKGAIIPSYPRHKKFKRTVREFKR